MTTETKHLEVTAYRDKEKNPCCTGNFDTGEVCIFYRSARFGTLETCVFAEDRGKRPDAMRRRGDGTGTLIPLKCCPIWPNHQEKRV